MTDGIWVCGSLSARREGLASILSTSSMNWPMTASTREKSLQFKHYVNCATDMISSFMKFWFDMVVYELIKVMFIAVFEVLVLVLMKCNFRAT